MKRILATLLILFIFNPVYSASLIGKGDLKFSEQSLKMFIDYLNNKGGWGGKNLTFIISEDGEFSNYNYCNGTICQGGAGRTRILINDCLEKYNKKCWIFAQTRGKERVIRWNNSNFSFELNDNYHPKSKLSEDEIKNTLIKLSYNEEDLKKIEKKEIIKISEGKYVRVTGFKGTWDGYWVSKGNSGCENSEYTYCIFKDDYKNSYFKLNNYIGDTKIPNPPPKFISERMLISSTKKDNIFYKPESGKLKFVIKKNIETEKNNLVETLRNLKKLNEDGILSDEEFKKAKEKVINQ